MSGATTTLREFWDDETFGVLVVPAARNKPETLSLEQGRWAMDNGAYAGFTVGPFVAMLEQFFGYSGALFVTAPDVVADAQKTLRLFPFWSSVIAGLGFPVAFVAQDGLTERTTPWDLFQTLFIGGSTVFKDGPIARLLIRRAKREGKQVHMGRVNTKKRLFYAADEGVDSVDGTAISMFPRVRFPLYQRWMAEYAS